jgi:alkylhydroperoxidase family enzyme
MTRIPYANIERSSGKVRDFFAKMGGNSAEVQNIFRMIAHSDISVREFMRLGSRLLRRARLDSRFRELAILRIAQMLEGRYEWAHHVPIAVRVGVTPDQIRGLATWRESALFTAQQKTVLAYTEEVVRDSQPSQETFTAAAEFLDHQSLVELTLSIGYWSMVAKFLKTFQVDVEEPFLREHAELFGYTGLPAL